MEQRHETAGVWQGRIHKTGMMGRVYPGLRAARSRWEHGYEIIYPAYACGPSALLVTFVTVSCAGLGTFRHMEVHMLGKVLVRFNIPRNPQSGPRYRAMTRKKEAPQILFIATPPVCVPFLTRRLLRSRPQTPMIAATIAMSRTYPMT